MGSQSKKLRRSNNPSLQEVQKGLAGLGGLPGKLEEFIQATQKMEELFSKLEGMGELGEVVPSVKEAIGKVESCVEALGAEQRRQRWVFLQLLYYSFSNPADVVDLDKLALVEEKLRSDFDRAEADAK